MTERDQHLDTYARLMTGVSGLDTVLRGGLISSAVYIIEGSPGAGKTILANQIAFHRAAQGEHCLYVTLLAESHDRLIGHLKGLTFFREAEVPQSVYYESAFGTLESEGLDGVLRLLTRERKARQASVIVLDGLFVLEETVRSEAEFRKFVNNLSTFAGLSNSIILMLTNSARTPRSPEYTMVDGWIELGSQQIDYKSYRYLQVHKFRGSGFISGRHMTDISNQGIAVFPRLESSIDTLRVTPPNRRFLTTGVTTLDQMMGGGVRHGSATLIVGPSGIGKTTFGLQYINECTPDEPGLIFGFYEHEEDLIEKAQLLGLDLEALIRSGAVSVIWQPPTENVLDQLGYDLLEAVRQRGVKRLFVDGVDGFRQSAIYPERLSRFLSALTNALRTEDVTMLYTLETDELVGGEPQVKFGSISALSQNIVLLRFVELENEIRRTLTIMKVRTSRFDGAIRDFSITDSGIYIGERFRRVDDVLTGHAHPRPLEE